MGERHGGLLQESDVSAQLRSEAELLRKRESAKPANTALPKNVAGWLRAKTGSLTLTDFTDFIPRWRRSNRFTMKASSQSSMQRDHRITPVRTLTPRIIWKAELRG